MKRLLSHDDVRSALRDLTPEAVRGAGRSGLRYAVGCCRFTIGWERGRGYWIFETPTLLDAAPYIWRRDIASARKVLNMRMWTAVGQLFHDN